jgi:hypothetical protein
MEELKQLKLPTADFGVNAAWWWIMIIALNLNAMMKKIALNPCMKTKRMKAIRFSIINIPGRVINRSRRLILRLSKGHPAYDVFVEARRKIAMLSGALVTLRIKTGKICAIKNSNFLSAMG